MTIWRDAARTQRDLAAGSTADADRYPQFQSSVRAVNAVVRKLTAAPAPSIDEPSAGDLIELLKTGRRFRALGRRNAYNLLRWLPMPISDFAQEWFEHAALRVAVAAGGVLGSHVGPRSAGSTAIFLLLSARHDEPLSAGWTARGGIGAVAEALAAAARQAGVEIRTGAGVDHILVRGQMAEGVVLHTGEEIRTRAVVSSADPRRTLSLVDPLHLPPDFRDAARNIRMRGTLSKINFAVSALPTFSSLSALDAASRSAALTGWIRLARDVDSIERASMRRNTAPLPTSRSSSWRYLRSSIQPRAGRSARRVGVRAVHAARAARHDMGCRARAARRRASRASSSAMRPGSSGWSSAGK